MVSGWLAFVLAGALASGNPDREALERGAAALGRLLIHRDTAVREAAADGLDALGPAVELAFPSILEALRSSDGARATAKALIIRIGPRAAALVPELVAYGRSGEPGTRELVVDLCGALTPSIRGAEGFLNETVVGGPPGVRERAARALLLFDPTRTAARDLLSRAVRDGTIAREPRLAVALGRAGLDLELSTWVSRALGDELVENARFAAEVLKNVDARSAAAVPALVTAMHAGVGEVRLAAIDAIGRIGPEARAANESLDRLLSTGTPPEWLAAARALARIQPSHAATAIAIVAGIDEPTRPLDDVAAALAELEPDAASREISARFDRGDRKAKLRVLELAAALLARAANQDELAATSAPEMRAALHARRLADAAAALILRATAAVEPEVRARAIADAAALPGHDVEVASRLLELLADDDAAVRKAALDGANGRELASGAVAQRLGSQPSSGDPDVVARGAGALAHALAADLAPGFAAASAARFDADTLIDLCVRSDDVDLRGFALRDAEIVLLIEAASASDEVRARLAARALQRDDGPVSAAAAVRLMQALAAGPDFLKIAAAQLLDSRCVAKETAIAGLVRALGESEAVAAVAADSLVTHGEAAARALATALDEGAPLKRRRVIGTLAMLKGAGRPAAPALLAATDDPDPEIARAASIALFAVLTNGEIEERLQRLERGR